MTCEGCTTSVENSIKQLLGVVSAKATLPNALQIESEWEISEEKINSALKKAGNYWIESNNAASSISYKQGYISLFIILLYIIFIACIPFIKQSNVFDSMLFMQTFMASFFLIFSFFKIINLSLFANSFSMYDIIAKRIKIYGYIFPFIELGLGILFALGLFLKFANIVTAIISSIILLGVGKQLLNKNKIECACLGNVIKMPLSTATLIENGIMLAMSIVMLWQM